MSRQHNHRLFAKYPEVASLNEVQKMLGISRSAVVRLFLDRQIAAIHSGKHVYFLKSSVVEFVQRHMA